MNEKMLSVRELQEEDIPFIVKYWLKSESSFLISMGVDLAKLPTKSGLTSMLREQIDQSYQGKHSYCIIWEVNKKPVGHSNVNKIKFGEEAYMHLHLWDASLRKKGMGAVLVKMTLPYFFRNLELKTLYCEPYALNPAPNKTLEKVGFTFLKRHRTIPGSLNFEQEVNRWALSYEQFQALK